MGHAQPRGQASDQAGKVGQTGVSVTEAGRFEGTPGRPDLPRVIRNADTDHGSNSTQERLNKASQIYQWVYAQPVSTLARELIRLRTGRPARRSGLGLDCAAADTETRRGMMIEPNLEGAAAETMMSLVQAAGDIDGDVGFGAVTVLKAVNFVLDPTLSFADRSG